MSLRLRGGLKFQGLETPVMIYYKNKTNESYNNDFNFRRLRAGDDYFSYTFFMLLMLIFFMNGLSIKW